MTSGLVRKWRQKPQKAVVLQRKIRPRAAHNPEVVGSSPASATRKEKVIPIGMAFFFYPACVASFGSTSGFPEGSEGSAAGGR